MHVRSFACAVSAVALLSVAGPAAVANAGTADPCDAKLLAYFKADDAVQTAQENLTAAQQALNGANGAQNVMQNADAAIRAAILALPWTKASTPAQLNLGQAVRTYKSIYIKAFYSGPAASAENPSGPAQKLVDAAQKLVDNAKLGSDQGTKSVLKRVAQGASDLKAAYPLFLSIPGRRADVAQALQQADKVQSTVSGARGGIESCLQNAKP